MVNAVTERETQKFAEGAHVNIGGRMFTVEFGEDSGTVWLTGVRGAVLFLRPFLERKGGDSGFRQVVSWKSGATLRNKFSQEVRVFVIGDTITDMTGVKTPKEPQVH